MNHPRTHLLACALTTLLAGSAAAQATRPQDMPSNLWSAFKEQAAPEGLLTIGVTAALVAAARPDDHRVKSAVLSPDHPIGPSLADAGTWLGNAAVLFPVMGAVYGAGWATDSGAAQETGAMGLEALALGGVEADVMKYAAQRERPDGADKYSFPSGHATESFAVASVLGSQYGWEAGVPAYLAAGFVGYSRLQNDKHWLSDVVAGAGLGILSGRAVYRAHRRAGRVALTPWLAPGRTGVILAARF